MRRFSLLPALGLLGGLAHASCGSSFCTVNTLWDTQGLSNSSGLLVDLRYAYSNAEQWRGGSAKKTLPAASGSGEEIENRGTVNQIVNLNLDYALDRNWGLQLGLPFVIRDHRHLLDTAAPGAPVEQQAKFDEVGDIRVQARYRLALDGHAGAGLRFGVKLPTGATNKTMTPPDPNDPTTPYALERSSQPGTGSTDAIVGAYYFRNAADNGFGWFVSAQFQSALAIKDDYRPGNETTLDLGLHYEVAERLNLLLQLNGQYKARDGGGNANPASGGHALHLSPGLSYGLGDGTMVYGFVQLPLLRYLNTDPADAGSGQLSAAWSATLGLSRRF